MPSESFEAIINCPQRIVNAVLKKMDGPATPYTHTYTHTHTHTHTHTRARTYSRIVNAVLKEMPGPYDSSLQIMKTRLVIL
jgi:hypothetical protein